MLPLRILVMLGADVSQQGHATCTAEALQPVYIMLRALLRGTCSDTMPQGGGAEWGTGSVGTLGHSIVRCWWLSTDCLTAKPSTVEEVPSTSVELTGLSMLGMGQQQSRWPVGAMGDGLMDERRAPVWGTAVWPLPGLNLI
jgi:hypothetical protein